jgi:hypothetical protein
MCLYSLLPLLLSQSEPGPPVPGNEQVLLCALALAVQVSSLVLQDSVVKAVRYELVLQLAKDFSRYIQE